MFDLAPPQDLEQRTRLQFQAVERVGDDLRVLARFAPHD